MKNKIIVVTMALIYSITLTASSSAVWAKSGNGQDQKIKSSVEKRLQDRKLLKNNEIIVAVEGRNVILTGSASDIHQISQIEQQTGKAAKGYIIVNNLQVTPSNLNDQQLREKILTQLKNNVFYSIYDWVGFDVNNGTVTLTGWVREPWHKKQFEHAIQNVPGVTKLDDQLQIETGSIFDDELRNQAANLIYNNPSFEPYANTEGAPIHIIVNRGQVYLEGVVARADMRNWAENTIFMNTKAFQVFDDLKVQGYGSAEK